MPARGGQASGEARWALGQRPTGASGWLPSSTQLRSQKHPSRRAPRTLQAAVRAALSYKTEIMSYSDSLIVF